MSKKGEVFAIDANVILRYLLEDDKRLSGKAARILRGVESGETVVTCDPVTLAEVVWVLKSHYKLPNREISEGVAPIVKADGFLMPNKSRYILALELLADSVKEFRDACACAEALEECEGRLYSFDRKLSSVSGIRRTESVPRRGKAGRENES